jgi:hypothetical protein
MRLRFHMRLGSTEGYGCHRGVKARDGKKGRGKEKEKKRGEKEGRRKRGTILFGTSPTSREEPYLLVQALRPV